VRPSTLRTSDPSAGESRQPVGNLLLRQEHRGVGPPEPERLNQQLPWTRAGLVKFVDEPEDTVDSQAVRAGDLA